MAEQQHFEGFDSEPEELSRSAYKREAQAIRKLADKIADLGTLSFKHLNFPDESVKEAFVIARGMRKNSDEKRRQLQFAAKLLRAYDAEDLKKQIKSIGATPKADPNAMRLENLRENLIRGGVKALNTFTAVINDTDRNKLRTLIKKAKDELAQEKGERPAARALFKYIKSELQRSGAAIPDELAKPYIEEEGK
ncbi:ribosome biogenesis factor YjgA [Succinatimonas hippei]|uniref:ribosome biogenesis factor YjgA n=1 Tax=Succinatimonas hippei TaxID=626938 RepID=UPI0025A35B94|nr:ribosome biogenesis factor YjgA [Succinatimonas hippei]MDM8119961.1 ribosome biogenesis factor YjgA [Succinatimonas hippei]